MSLLAAGILIHTHFFGAGFFGGFTGLSCSNVVGCQDSELILHPGTQVSDSGWQLLPPEQLRNWETSQKNNLSSKPCEICHWEWAMLVMCYLLSLHVWYLKRMPVTQLTFFFFYLLNKLHIHTTYTQTVRWNQHTSCNGLPSERERRSGLDGVAEDGAVVVHPRSPGHRGSGLWHLSHLTVHRGARGTW